MKRLPTKAFSAKILLSRLKKFVGGLYVRVAKMDTKQGFRFKRARLNATEALCLNHLETSLSVAFNPLKRFITAVSTVYDAVIERLRSERSAKTPAVCLLIIAERRFP